MPLRTFPTALTRSPATLKTIPLFSGHWPPEQQQQQQQQQSSCLNGSKCFHSSANWHAEASNHYETLGISPSASQSEIKKQYYTLSKSTHPDRNPGDPNAASRFSAVSDAYHVLGNTDKRARYDRDVLRKRDPVPRQGTHSSSQSGFSGGLNKSKSPFRGPPRSFYESGGYGKNKNAGRRAEEAERTAANARKRAGEWYSGGGDAGTQGGFSPGQGAPRGFDNDVPHFDHDQHYRTQEAVTGRMSGRRRVREEDIPDAGVGGGFGWPVFFVISVTTGFAALVTSMSSR